VNGLQRGGDAQPAERIGEMVFHGALAYAELAGDFLVEETTAAELQDLALAWAQNIASLRASELSREIPARLPP
jgi:hypothetical protein